MQRYQQPQVMHFTKPAAAPKPRYQLAIQPNGKGVWQLVYPQTQPIQPAVQAVTTTKVVAVQQTTYYRR